MPTMPTRSRYGLMKAKQKKKEHNLEWNRYYQDKIYMQNKKIYKQNHPLCEDCLKEGIIKPAEHLHHITEFSLGKTEDKRFELLRDINNFVCLCLECHKKRHKENHTGLYKILNY